MGGDVAVGEHHAPVGLRVVDDLEGGGGDGGDGEVVGGDEPGPVHVQHVLRDGVRGDRAGQAVERGFLRAYRVGRQRAEAAGRHRRLAIADVCGADGRVAHGHPGTRRSLRGELSVAGSQEAGKGQVHEVRLPEQLHGDVRPVVVQRDVHEQARRALQELEGVERRPGDAQRAERALRQHRHVTSQRLQRQSVLVLIRPVREVVGRAVANHEGVEAGEGLGVRTARRLPPVHVEVGVVHAEKQVGVVGVQVEGVTVEGGDPPLAADLCHGRGVGAADVVADLRVAVRPRPVAGAGRAGKSGPVDVARACFVLVARATVVAGRVHAPWASRVAHGARVAGVALTGAIGDLVAVLTSRAAQLHPGKAQELQGRVGEGE